MENNLNMRNIKPSNEKSNIKAFKHRSFEERLKEYDGKITVGSYDWGNPKGREML